MMIRLEKITGKNIRDLLKLNVSEDQKGFVAANDTSIIEAYIAVTSGGHAFPFGIYDGDLPVGFCMIGYGTDDSWEDAPAVAKDSYNIWRLMIDRRYQGRGYGKAAMRLILDFIAAQPCGPAELCWLSYEPENTAAKALYASFGFRETGEFDGEEMIAVKSLRPVSPAVPAGAEIRRAAPEDIPAAAGLAAELWPHHPVEEFMEEFTSLLADNGRGLFLAFADGVPAGFAECSLRHDYVEGTQSSPVGYLEGIYVKETVRHRGIARSLLSACEAWARKKGCSEFASDCELTNIESQGFHRAVGFTEANRLVAYVRKL